jgi:hypothetical protein
MKSRGRVRPDMGEGCPERFDWEFIKYTWNFKKNQGASSKERILESGKPVVLFRSRREARRYMENIRRIGPNPEIGKCS